MSDKQNSHLRSTVALVLIGIVPFLAAAKPAEFHVSPKGHDNNPGTESKPFATLERARDAIRESGLAGKTTCTVWLQGGIHRRQQTFALDEQDSGTREYAIIYRGAKEETARLIGGTVLKPDAFSLVDDQVLLDRMPESARGRVYMLDLEAQAIKHTTRYPDKFTDNGGIFELFFNSKRMPVSIYPNKHGGMTVKRVVVHGGGQEKPGSWRDYYGGGTPEQRRALESGKGPRPGVFEYRPEHAAAHARWAKVLDRGVWLKGYWRVVWQNETVRVGAIDTEKQTVTLAVPVSHGIGSKYHRPDGSGEEIYWVMNLLEAVDQPGEWAVDFQDKRLFFYPPGPLAACLENDSGRPCEPTALAAGIGNRRVLATRPTLARSAQSISRHALADADILISDMESPIVEVRDAHHIEFRNITIEGTLGDGVRVVDGSENALRGCTIRNVAKYGVVIEGGSRNVVESCDLYALGAGGVGLSGGDAGLQPRVPAGHRVENCDIHHFGEIERVYAPGVNVGYRGGGGGSAKLDAVGMVVRHNAIHHCPHAGVLFNSFDNLFEYNEVFQFALVSNDMGAFYSYSKPGGIGNNTFRYNFMHSSPEGDGVYYDNVANHPRVYGNVAYKLGPADPAKEAKRGCGFLIKNGTSNRVDIFNNIAVDCKTGYWINAGEGSVVRDNVAVACGNNHGAADLKTYEADPGFVNQAAMNLALREDAALYAGVQGFEQIPFAQIGLYVDEFRTTVPGYRHEMADWTPGQDASRYDVLDRE